MKVFIYRLVRVSKVAACRDFYRIRHSSTPGLPPKNRRSHSCGFHSSQCREGLKAADRIDCVILACRIMPRKSGLTALGDSGHDGVVLNVVGVVGLDLGSKTVEAALNGLL